MSVAYQAEFSDCCQCEHLHDGCDRHTCEWCGNCEGTLLCFQMEDDDTYDLCPECYIEMQRLLNGKFTKINQGIRPVVVPIYSDKIKVVRKTIKESEREEIFERDGRKCVYCGSTERLQIDHIIPFSKGGTTSHDNLQTLCKSCNGKKRDCL